MIKKLKLMVKDVLIFIGFWVIGFLIMYFLMKNGIQDYYLANLIAYLIGLCFLSIFFYKDFLKFFPDFKKNFKKYVPKYFSIGLLGIILMNITSNIISNLVGTLSSNETLIRNLFDGSTILIIILSVGIVTPICEEIIFRLNFKNLFKNKYLFSLITGFLFALMHMINATSLIDFVFIFPYWIMGSLLSYIYFDSDNLLNSIMVHSFNNLVTLLFLLMAGRL